MTTHAPLARGERAPDFVLPRADGEAARFYALAGGAPTVLVISDAAREALRYVEALRRTAVPIFAVARADGDVRDPSMRAPMFVDREGRVASAYRATAGTTAFVLDASLRVLATISEVDRLAEGVATAMAGLSPTADVTVAVQAPVLLVPRALPEDVCAELIEVWDTGGHAETGVERSKERRRGDALVAEAKRRRDHVVADPDLMRRITQAVGRRVLPEVRHAFGYSANRFEGFKIGCYDAEWQGHFTAHRDNLSPTTAHRRFALSLNLNDAYEGGELRFPEYSAQRYRPPAGAALVFSCSLLHEVLPVTDGQRFVLLSFLFSGERAQPRPSGVSPARP